MTFFRFTRVNFPGVTISRRQGSPYHTVDNDGVLDKLKFINKRDIYQVYGNPILDTLITNEIKISEAYKTFFGISTGLIPQMKGICKSAHETKATVVPKKTATTFKKKQSKRKLVLHDESDESEGGPENRPTGRKKRTPRAVVIQEPPKIDTQRAIKASKCESIFQHQTGGSSKGAGLRPEVLDELTRKSADSDEGAGTSPEKDEKPEDILWQSIDDEESENDDEEDDASIDIEKTDDERTNTDIEDQAEEEQKGDDQAGDEQLVVPISTTQKETPSLLQSTSSHSGSSNFAVKSIVQRFTELEKAVKELKQADHSTTILASIRSQVPSVVKEYLGSRLPGAFQKVLRSHTEELKKELSKRRDYKDVIEESVHANVINEVKNFIPKFLPHAVKEALEKIPPSLDYYFEDQYVISIKEDTAYPCLHLPKTTKERRSIRRIQKKSIRRIEDIVCEYSGRYQAWSLLQEIPNTPYTILGYAVNLRLERLNLANPRTANKSVEEPIFEVASDDVEQTLVDKKASRPETLYPEWNTVKTINDTPEQSWLNEMIQDEKPLLTFDELMSTPTNFPAFVMNRLKLNKITRVDLVGPVFNLLKGTCKSCVELECNMEECYRALTDQLDWANPKGHKSPFDMSKHVPL
ncbi:hypothetical protein Tco_0632603 [Tanacetum coccineum]